MLALSYLWPHPLFSPSLNLDHIKWVPPKLIQCSRFDVLAQNQGQKMASSWLSKKFIGYIRCQVICLRIWMLWNSSSKLLTMALQPCVINIANGNVPWNRCCASLRTRSPAKLWHWMFKIRRTFWKQHGQCQKEEIRTCQMACNVRRVLPVETWQSDNHMKIYWMKNEKHEICGACRYIPCSVCFPSSSLVLPRGSHVDDGIATPSTEWTLQECQALAFAKAFFYPPAFAASHLNFGVNWTPHSTTVYIARYFMYIL